MHPKPASRTLTFLFTDLEGSTRLWERHPQAMKNALKRHDAILRDAVASSNGPVVKRTGPWGVHANPVWAAFEGAGPREALDGCLRVPALTEDRVREGAYSQLIELPLGGLT